jgi:hypothetical protein
MIRKWRKIRSKDLIKSLAKNGETLIRNLVKDKIQKLTKN